MGRKKQKIKMVVADVLSDANHGKLYKQTGKVRSWMHVFLKTAAMPRLCTLLDIAVVRPL
jgi:hypothetical protein